MTAGLLVSINTSSGGVPKLPRHRAFIGKDGTEGDGHRDRRRHGGPDKAVCLFSVDRLRELQHEGHDVSVGSLGENLTVAGLDWRRLTPGTRLAVGDVRLALTTFTVPCRNLSPYFAEANVARVSQTAHPGWSRVYARVEQAGDVHIGDPVLVLDEAAVEPPVTPPVSALAVRRQGTLVVPASAEQVFPLFTPDGERLWVPDFDPEYLHPQSGEQGPGAIFTTQHGGEFTLWMVLRLSAAQGIAEYARVTPGSRRGLVHVRVEPQADRTTRVLVTYELTATSEAGTDALRAFTDEAFASMLGDWEQRLAHLVTHDTFD